MRGIPVSDPYLSKSNDMSTTPYFDLIDAKTGTIAPEAVGDRGKELAESYRTARPFPHVVLENAFPEALLRTLMKGFERPADSNLNETYDRAQERFKTSFHPDTLAAEQRAIFYAFNSRPFLRLMQNITGIKGLIPDPYFLGAGLHEIKQGGHLSIHADFNHHVPMNLERRINVLIYLNDDWKDEYGGQLELWTSDMSAKVVSLVPVFNRCVIFDTTSESQHGNPVAIDHPQGVSRKSIALYYYTATWSADRRSHTTQFKVRPGSSDKRDWKVMYDEFKKSITPPIVNHVRHAVRWRLEKRRRTL